MKIKNEEYAQRFLPLPNGHTLPKCKVIKTFLNWLNEIAVELILFNFVFACNIHYFLYLCNANYKILL